MKSADRVRVHSLWTKPASGAAMLPRRQLVLTSRGGIADDVDPAAGSPRQVLIVSIGLLEAARVDPPGSRCNVILSGSTELAPGSLVRVGTAALRITMRCPPCARGARLAGVAQGAFTALPRYLGAVVRSGSVAVDDAVEHRADAFARPPQRMAARCAWAVRNIPAGSVVSTRDLLAAIGAEPAYARALPQWLTAAGAKGAPVHRVVRTGPSDAAPSWAPDARTLLGAESDTATIHPLGEFLWFRDTGAQP